MKMMVIVYSRAGLKAFVMPMEETI